ncbi:unnamed protein product [Phyllotreta striolata]|uniref:L-2-hydroxyglutarate dehydrogenase, mitochondrial n=1 Tax=Phyllotreta striolata TaxID=444603 RepID=A0A9N9XUH9_PHYSR|nr:unnamed protein product [Phyllotreta striolata]
MHCDGTFKFHDQKVILTSFKSRLSFFTRAMSLYFCPFLSRIKLRYFLQINYGIVQTCRRNVTLKVQENYGKNLEEALRYDVAIIGGGIIGTAIGRQLKKVSKNLKTIIIEKEDILAKHQSRKNSGVIHCGIYYKPGSLKSVMCKKGIDYLYKYCDNERIPYKKPGKLIVASTDEEIKALKELYRIGCKTGVTGLELLPTIEKILEKEPKCKGLWAIWCSSTGNVDFEMVTNQLAQEFRMNQGDVLLNNQVNMIKHSDDPDYPVLIKCNENLYLKSKYLIVSGGIQSGKLQELIVGESSFKCRIFVSFRVNYHVLKGQPVKVNVYEVPDLELPFLGVHLSPKLNNTTLLGPTAVPAYSIEGYNEEELNLAYLKNTIASKNFLNMTRRYLSKCIGQAQNRICPDDYIKKLQRLADFDKKDVSDGPIAVQTQLVNADGTFHDDFVFEFFEGRGIQKRIINCVFLPSPAATCCLAIAEYVSDKFFNEYKKNEPQFVC